MNVSRRTLPIVIFAALGLLAAACGGLSASEWRRELEPLLPDGVAIVDSWTENCTIEPNCAVGFVLEHDRSRYAEDVATFEATMVAEGWTKTSGVVQDESALVTFERGSIKVTFIVLSESWRERCVSIYGPDSGNCQSTLLVKN